MCKYCEHFDNGCIAEELVNKSDIKFGMIDGELVTSLMLLPDTDPDLGRDILCTDPEYNDHLVPIMAFDSWISSYDSDIDIISEYFKIKYCPFCGRDLEEVIKNNK